jgi:hypothetical protein
MHSGLHVKYPLFFHILIKLELPRQTVEKYSNIKFNENPTGGSRDLPREKMDR